VQGDDHTERGSVLKYRRLLQSL